MSVDSSLNKLRNAITTKFGEMDAAITDRDAAITDRDNTIDGMNNIINMQRVTIADQNNTIAAKDATISDFSNLWEEKTSDGTDAYGPYMLYNSNSASETYVYRNGGYFKFKKELDIDHEYVWFPHKIINSCYALDLSNVSPSFVQKIISGKFPTNGRGSEIARLILPTVFSVYAKMLQYPPVVTYLPATLNINKSDWVQNQLTGVTSYVKCPENSKANYYLHKFDLNAESMVNVFNNLADVTGGGSTWTITLGSTNLTKLTEEQKNIAYAKGWVLA